jgi:hypothetical protein
MYVNNTTRCTMHAHLQLECCSIAAAVADDLVLLTFVVVLSLSMAIVTTADVCVRCTRSMTTASKTDCWCAQ